LDSAAADLLSKPRINESTGTKIPPPPTPPTVPRADPENPITVATNTLHPNSNFCTHIKLKSHQQYHSKIEKKIMKQRK